ncbi:MAG: WD40-repeat-containing domain protein [Benniella sp.]|nr:MAG: WD40-repeat-containing domain protein [Benniella sp.]
MGSPSLLDRVQEKPDVEGNLRQLRRQRLSERGKFVYIPLQAKANLQAHDEVRFPLMEKLEEFLSSDQKVFLLLGDSGAGKSTFNRQLESHLWQSYKKGGVIPLYINLPAIDKPEHDMIAKQLRKAEFTEPQIRELKVHRKFTLICDGYDESQQSHNLYTSNRLNQTGEWNAKMVISCRSEYLGIDYRDRFQPGDRNRQSESSLFKEAVITPFSMSQVQDYITQYVSVYRPLWEVNEYMKSLELIPSLKELVKNPFMMSLSLEVLPRMVNPGQDLSATQITRTALYDQFIEHWLERGKKRLGEKNLGPQAKSAFESLIDEGFTRNGIDYLKKLSVAIYKEQDGQPIVTYSRYKDENSWKAPFFSREEEKQLLREACPLIRNGNQHRFIHRSRLEYGVALATFDPHDWKEKTATQATKSRVMNTRSVANSNDDDGIEEAPSMIEQEPDTDSPLIWRSFINEPSTLQFLEERVLQEPLFRQQLLYYIEQSKTDKKWCIAAANAITILVRAGYQFNSADLRRIRVPNADLSYGMFESSQLQGADLRNVDLRGTYGMTIAAGLNDGWIAVYPTSNWESLWTLESHNREVLSIAYSPDNIQIASGSQDGTVRLWNSQTEDCDHVLHGHYDWVQFVAYSPQGNQVASASDDQTVKLWDVQTECQHMWIGHTEYVLGVIYSPNGSQVASNSQDYTIRLWDIEAERYSHVLRGHEHYVVSTAYSSQGDQFASGSYDRTVRMWDVATGNAAISSTITPVLSDRSCIHPTGINLRLLVMISLFDCGMLMQESVFIPYRATTKMSQASYIRHKDTLLPGVCRQTMTGHSQSVTSVVFSPKGDQVASSSYDKTVRLWDVGAGTSRYISSGHNSVIREVKCSPRSGHIATCSEDSTARIWEIATGICHQILRGRSGSMNDVAYSPQGDQIASCSADSTVRLWNAETGACIHTLTGHNNAVNVVAYSPHGHQLASASDDYTVRLWDVRSGECSNILIGHTSPSEVCNHTLTYQGGWRRSVAYSPQGDQIAFGSDTAVRVYDVGTQKYRHIFIGHNHEVFSATYSLRGDQIASGSKDGTVKVWDIESRTCLWTLAGHTGNVHKILYSSRGDIVITVSDDKSVRLWGVMSGQCLAVIQGFKVYIWDIAWIEAGEINYLAAGCEDGSGGMWQARVTEDHYRVSLHWMSTKGELDVKDANIQDVQGLNQLDKQLLKQRGALGEPVHRLSEASKKLATIASVVSKLKTPSHEVEDPALITGVVMGQPEQRDSQAVDVQLRDIVAAFVRDTRGFL